VLPGEGAADPASRCSQLKLSMKAMGWLQLLDRCGPSASGASWEWCGGQRWRLAASTRHLGPQSL